jgi:hypothetical protein
MPRGVQEIPSAVVAHVVAASLPLVPVLAESSVERNEFVVMVLYALSALGLAALGDAPFTDVPTAVTRTRLEREVSDRQVGPAATCRFPTVLRIVRVLVSDTVDVLLAVTASGQVWSHVRTVGAANDIGWSRGSGLPGRSGGLSSGFRGHEIADCHAGMLWATGHAAAVRGRPARGGPLPDSNLRRAASMLRRQLDRESWGSCSVTRNRHRTGTSSTEPQRTRRQKQENPRLHRGLPAVAGHGIDPWTFRFSVERSTN